jgi:hypothetical protein
MSRGAIAVTVVDAIYWVFAVFIDRVEIVYS